MVVAEPADGAARAERRDGALIHEHAVAERVGRHAPHDRALALFLEALEIAEEEHPVPLDRPGDRAAVDVLVELRRLVLLPGLQLRELQEILVARRGGAAERPVARAVVLIGPALGHQRHLRAARSAAVGVVVGRADAELLQGFLRDPDRRGERRLVLRVVHVDAVERHVLLVRTRAGHRTVARVFGVGVGVDGDEHRARLQAEQLDDVLGLDRQAANLLGRDRVAQAAVGGVEDDRLRHHRDGLGDAAQFERGILSDGRIHDQRDAGG